MTCRDVIDSLGAYVDGELPQAARRRLDEHLGACAACTSYLDTYRATIKLAKGALAEPGDRSPADVPDELVKRILAGRRER